MLDDNKEVEQWSGVESRENTIEDDKTITGRLVIKKKKKKNHAETKWDNDRTTRTVNSV